MKCCICGKEIDGYGNNPEPLCLPDDTQSRCCDECNNNYVITARIIQMHGKNKKLEENDLVAIFCCKGDTTPIDTLVSNGKVLAGYVDSDEQFYKDDNKWFGTWGNFLLDTEEDSYAILDS